MADHNLEIVLTARDNASSVLRDVGTNVKKTSDTLSSISSAMSKSFSAVSTYLAVKEAVAAVKAIADVADSWRLIETRLKLVSTSYAELYDTQSKLVSIADATRTSYEDVSDVYTRMARSLSNTTYAQKDFLEVTETISKALKIGGDAAESQKAALVQLGQAFSYGLFQGEELKSVMENTSYLGRTIADGLGKTIGQLKKLGAEGKISATDVMEAIKKQKDTVDATFSKLSGTLGEAFTVLWTGIKKTVSEFDKQTDSIGKSVTAVYWLRDAFKALSDASALFFSRTGVFESRSSSQIEDRIAELREFIAEQEATKTGAGSFLWTARDEAALSASKKALSDYVDRLKSLRAEEATALQQKDRKLPGLSTSAAVEELDKYIQKLREVSETAGFSAREKSIYEAKKSPAFTAESEAQINAIYDVIEAEEKRKEAAKKSEEATKKSASEYAALLKTQADYLQNLQKEIDQIGLDAAAKERMTAAELFNKDARLSTANAMITQKNALEALWKTAKEADEAMAENIADGEKKAVEYDIERRKNQAAAAKEAAEEYQRSLDKQMEEQEHFLEKVQDATADTLYDIFTGAVDGFGDLMDQFEKLFLRTLAEMAAQAIAKPIIVPIVQSIAGSLGLPGFSGISGGGGSAFGGDLFSSPLVSKGVNWAANSLGFSGGASGSASLMATPLWGGDITTEAGFFGSGSVGPTLGNLGLAFAAGNIGYSTVGKWIGLPQGEYSGLTAGGGAALGWTAGSVIPGIGNVVGAIVGSIIGGVGGSFLGGDGNRHLTIGTTPDWKYGQNIDFEPGYDNFRNRHIVDTSHNPFYGNTFGALEDSLNALTTGIYDQVNAIIEPMPDEIEAGIKDSLNGLSIEFPKGWQINSEDVAGGLKLILDTVGKQIWDQIEPILIKGYSQTIGQFVTDASGSEAFGYLADNSVIKKTLSDSGLFNSDYTMAEGADFTQYSQTAGDVVTAINQVSAAWDGITGTIENTLNPMSEYDSAMAAINTQFDGWISTLKALGFNESAIAKIEAGRKDVLEKTKREYESNRNDLWGGMIDYMTDLSGASTELSGALKSNKEYFDGLRESLLAKGLTADSAEYKQTFTNEAWADQQIGYKYEANRNTLWSGMIDYMTDLSGASTELSGALKSNKEYFDGLRESLLAKGLTADSAEYKQTFTNEAWADQQIVSNNAESWAEKFTDGINKATMSSYEYSLSTLEAEQTSTLAAIEEIIAANPDYAYLRDQAAAFYKEQKDAIEAARKAQKESFREMQLGWLGYDSQSASMDTISKRYHWGNYGDTYQSGSDYNWENIFKDGVLPFTSMTLEEFEAYAKELGIPMEQLQADITFLSQTFSTLDDQIQSSIDTWGDLSDSLRDQILTLKTGTTNPADIYERIGIQEQAISDMMGGMSLQEYMASLSSDAERSSALQTLQELFRGRLSLYGEGFQRPSLEYQEAFKTALADLSGLQDYADLMKSDYELQLDQNALLQQIVTNTTPLANLPQAADGAWTGPGGLFITHPNELILNPGQQRALFSIPVATQQDSGTVINLTVNASGDSASDVADKVARKLVATLPTLVGKGKLRAAIKSAANGR